MRGRYTHIEVQHGPQLHALHPWECPAASVAHAQGKLLRRGRSRTAALQGEHCRIPKGTHAHTHTHTHTQREREMACNEDGKRVHRCVIEHAPQPSEVRLWLYMCERNRKSRCQHLYRMVVLMSRVCPCSPLIRNLLTLHSTYMRCQMTNEQQYQQHKSTIILRNSGQGDTPKSFRRVQTW